MSAPKEETNMNGLHSCKPGNEPIVGQVKTFVVIHNPATENKKAWTKIKSASADQGGTPYRITSVTPTGFTDSYGNISFNIDIEPQSASSAQDRQHPLDRPSGLPLQGSVNGTGLDERQRAIIRQHSQSMALEVLKLKHALGELTLVDLSPVKLRALADYFDDDVLGAISTS